MLTGKGLHNPLPAAMAHLDELLDEALKDTFPASDPVAINVEPEPTGTKQPKGSEPGAPHRPLL